MPLHWLDIILAVVMLVSGFLAMLRGFVREILSIASWVAAALAAYFAFTNYRGDMRGYVQPDILADGILVGGTFIVVLLFVGGITMKISDKVLDSRIGLVDRIGGFVFGLARGLVLVVIAFTFFSWLVPEETQPNWIKNARSVNLLKDAGDTIISFLPDDPAFSLPGIDDDGADEEYKQ